jgi:hypothetical protein
MARSRSPAYHPVEVTAVRTPLPALVVALLAGPVLAQVEKPPAGPGAPSIAVSNVRPYNIGHRVAPIALDDLQGKKRDLFAETEGKAIALVFWSLRDPVSRRYVPVLQELARIHSDKLAIYLVNANADEIVGGAADPLDTIRRYLQDEKVTLPILIDRENRVADDFGATANVQVFLLDANRIVRYDGGIDDDPRGERKAKGAEVNQALVKALETVLKGDVPEQAWLQPGGRPIKRAPKAAPASAGGGG